MAAYPLQLIGTSIAHYQITARVGQGGMGEVFQATDTRLGREVAIKVLPLDIADDPHRRARFLREARAASALNHPNVCTLYEIGQADDGRPFLAMELLHGRTLDAVSGQGPMRPDQIIDIGLQIADALDTAHKAGLIHRDIKPSNIHLDRDRRVKVLDFGLAKRVGGSNDREATTIEVTDPGQVLGTPSYMSPEQTRGEPLDARSDLFSLGAVLYQLATGRLAFQGSSFAETAEKISRGQPEAIARFNYDVSAELERIIRKCLEKKAEDRYQTARDLLVDFRRLKRDSSTQISPTASQRRSRKWWSAAGFAAVVLLLGGGWWARQHSAAPDPLRFGKSVAVLPFRTDSAGMAFFVDGLGEELANALGKAKKFDKVPPWSSSSSFGDREKTLKAIAEKLEVSTLLEGRIQKSGNQLRISATLIDPFRGRSGAVMWSDTYDHNEAAYVPFAIQDKIARSIANSLQVELSSGEQSNMVNHYTKSPEAYEYYRKGRLLWTRRGANLKKSERCFELALLYDSPTGSIEDSTMAPAYVGLAAAYNQQAAYGLVKKGEVARQALYCIHRALEIDPQFAEAYATLGFLELTNGNALAAERAFGRAIELDDHLVSVRYWYAFFLWSTRQDVEAREQALKALEIDPVSESTRTMVAWQLAGANVPEKALEILQEVLGQYPDFVLAHYVRALAHLKLNDPVSAAQDLQTAVELSGAQPFIAALLAKAQALAGQTHQARETISALKPETIQGIQVLNELAGAYLALGEKEQCYAVLERSVVENRCNPYLVSTDVFNDLHAEPRFVDLVNRSGLLKYNPESRQFEVNNDPRDQLRDR